MKTKRLLSSLLLIVIFSPIAFADVYTDIFDQADYVIQIKTVKSIPTPPGRPPQLVLEYASGMIFDDVDHKEKRVLTVSHIINSADDVKNIQSLTAHFRSVERKPENLEIVGYDFVLDVALLRFIDQKAVKNIAVGKLGSSTSLKIGQEVAHIGLPSPILKWTISTGRINHLWSGFGGARLQPQVIVFDAMINRGSSGGLLLDANGMTIGIVTAMTGGPNYFSLAVPIDDIKKLLPALNKGGKVQHILLPVQDIRDLNNYQQAAITFEYNNHLCEFELNRLGIQARPPKAGVMVTRVKQYAAADQAGFMPGDVIISYNGKSVDLVDLYRMLYLETDNSKKFKFEID
ncbi:MAG: trypsin-like peptidase domain-containing protein [Patescibacteria group bacterium]